MKKGFFAKIRKKRRFDFFKIFGRSKADLGDVHELKKLIRRYEKRKKQGKIEDVNSIKKLDTIIRKAEKGVKTVKPEKKAVKAKAQEVGKAISELRKIFET